ncbi:hypothetical protein BJY01DRAFT_254662 [Aspergillus pseudoustus]|uniref:Uncharacterized protein n=1 Tax=Aspergillus pseudoustus TaxID=1810923 RepID=A0ABR4IU61_9EURO
MRATSLLALCALSGLLHIPTAVARRAGGSDSSSDSSDSDTSCSSHSNVNNDNSHEEGNDVRDDTSSSSSDDGPYCNETLRNISPSLKDLIPDYGDNRNSRGVNNYDGSYFFGETWLAYNIVDTPGLEDRCSESAENPVRVLRYAWMGPQETKLILY